MLSLDELCLRYGCDTKVDEVKLLWEAGVQTEDIDPDLLRVYLIGEDLPNGGRREGDIGNTRDVFIRQAEAIRKAGGLMIHLNPEWVDYKNRHPSDRALRPLQSEQVRPRSI